MSLGMLDSRYVHHDLCWMESVRLGHMHISYRERTSFRKSRVVNFVSRQHLPSCLATMRAVKSLQYNVVKYFIHLKKLTV